MKTKEDLFCGNITAVIMGIEKPFFVGQKVLCKKSTYSYPHDMRKKLVIDNVLFHPLTCLTKRDVDRSYYGHWRVYAHIDGRPEYQIDANARLFFNV